MTDKSLSGVPAVSSLDTGDEIYVVEDGNSRRANIRQVLNATTAADATIAALSSLDTGSGVLVQTAPDTFTKRTLQAPAAGITISNPGGATGDPTLVLANDLAGLEGQSDTGIVVRTGDGTYANRRIVAPAAGITISNGKGVGGNPTLALANDLAALEGVSDTGKIYYRGAADTWSPVTIGTGITFLAGTLATSAGDPGLVFISSQSASASATIDFTGFNDTYDMYEIRISTVNPATDAIQLQLLVGTGAGPTYQTSGYKYGYNIQVNGTLVNSGSNNAAFIGLTAVDIGNAGGECLNSAVLTFSNPDTANFSFVDFTCTGAYSRSDGEHATFISGGRYNTAAAITGIRLQLSSGNISSGKFALYGYRKS